MSGKYWWLAFPLFAFWGGFFWVGFKIYPDEIGIILAGAALGVGLIKNPSTKVKRRHRAPWAFMLLAGYFFAHLLASLFTAEVDWLGGGGSILRVYASGLTYLLFAWMYYKYGLSENIRLCFIILFILMLGRISLSMSSLSDPAFVDIFGGDILILYPMTDLRASALSQMLIGIILFYYFRGKWVRIGMMISIIAMVVLVMFGEGRVSVAMALSTLILWSVLAKRIKLLIILIPPLILSLAILYGEIHLLSLLPIEVQRAISFLPGLESQLFINTEASNRWHFDLFAMGFERWASSLLSLLFGNLVDPVGIYSFLKLDYFAKLAIAANTGRYESSLWTILATLGIVGMIFYIWIFAFLFREIVPIVMKEGIRSFNHAVYAIAIISLLLMILFGWIRGGFPGIELMLGVMAKALYEDSAVQIRQKS